MSFEAILTAGSRIDRLTQEKVILCFESKEQFRVLERKILDEKSSHVYSYIETSRETRPEDFFVSFEQKEVYLCFYSATSEQQIRITRFLVDCLHEAGVQAEFEEP